jgi:hypothetical protein
VLPSRASVDQVLRVFASTHVHMVVLTETGRVGARLTRTLLRDDLLMEPKQHIDLRSSSSPWRATPPGGEPAAQRSTLLGRTMRVDLSASSAQRHLNAAGQRRAAVIDHRGCLLGLLCVKHHGRGFCSDDDARARRRDPRS